MNELNDIQFYFFGPHYPGERFDVELQRQIENGKKVNQAYKNLIKRSKALKREIKRMKETA